jgi:outer membrane protein
MRFSGRPLLLVLGMGGVLLAQDLTIGWGTLPHGYRSPRPAPVRLANSQRIEKLTRDGKLYLSLQDAIALALEDNLDLELERYDLHIADTDVLRAKAGALPRGVSLSTVEGPAGVGAPSVGASITGPSTLGGGDIPALNAVVGTGTETDLSILGSLPLSTGPAPPNLDPTLNATFNWNKQSVPQNSTFLPGLRSLNSNSYETDVSLQKGFLTGGTASIGWDNLHQNINSPLLTYNPSITSSAYVSVTQPLLRGFGIGVNNRYIRITKNNRQVADFVFQQQVMNTVSAVSRLYWDLASLTEDVQVRREALQSAQQLLKDNQNAANEGTMAPIDVTRAKAEVARRQRDLSVSQTLVRQQGEILKDYLSKSDFEHNQSVNPGEIEVVVTDHVVVPPAESIGAMPELTAEAFKNRPDLAQARLQLENSQISLKGSKSALLPELDLFASVQNNSLIGDRNALANNPALTGSTPLGAVVTDPLFLGGFGDGLGQLANHNFPNYQAGLQLSIPLANRAARADVARDQLQTRQQEIRLRQLEKRVKLEITNAVLAVQQARSSYEAAVQERVLQQQTIESEKEKLDVGASTTYLVIQYEGDLAQAKSAEISAQSDYMKAKTALDRALGTILTANHVSLAEALDGVVSNGAASH